MSGKQILKFFLIACLFLPSSLFAFCGFYVSQADTKLFNKSSKVVIARNEDRTVITMANDYEGELKDFAIVIPVPVILKEKQIHVTKNSIIDHLDAYTAPRLVEYFDEDPCQPMRVYEFAAGSVRKAGPGGGARDSLAKKLGVTIEAEYLVGEYDILILSAKESNGLLTWLNQNNYKLPKGAEKILGSYIKQDTKFFVAKVNLEEQSKLGSEFLRPLQIAFESPNFMLPIRLGTLNANGNQDLFVFALSKKGRVETTNYRTVKIPSNMDIPLYVKDEFGDFYKDMFNTLTKKDRLSNVYLEYAWDMGWCDPCAADPLPDKDLRELGVFWLDKFTNEDVMPRPGRFRRPQGQNVYVTRLHLRYNAETFPEDLQFQETSNRENFQGRYVLRHPWKPDGSKKVCESGIKYLQNLEDRFEKEAQTLANLTNWDINTIRQKMSKKGQAKPELPEDADGKDWWEDLWS